MKKRLAKIISVCIIASVIGTAGYLGYSKYIGSKTVSAATNYINDKISKRNLQVNVQATGTVYAAVTRDIVANNSGEVKNLTLKEGDTVKIGIKIADIYNTQLQSDVDKAVVSLEKQKLQAATAKTDTDIQIQNLNTAQVEKELSNAVNAQNNMLVTSPINGLVVTKAVNNGDNVQSGKALVSVVDTSSYKIKISVDELDIEKLKVGQKAEIKFDAIDKKVYEGAVESISQLGTTENNVTTYDVVVLIKDLKGVRLGMNASVNVLVQNKENALTVPVEALVEKNGIQYVMVSKGGSSETLETDKTLETNGTDASKGSGMRGQMANMTEEEKAKFLKDRGVDTNNGDVAQRMKTRQNAGNNGGTGGYAANGNTSSGSGTLVKVETGLENENYVEILSGLSEGQSILITAPKSISSTNKNTKNGFSGMSGGMMGGSMKGR